VGKALVPAEGQSRQTLKIEGRVYFVARRWRRTIVRPARGRRSGVESRGVRKQREALPARSGVLLCLVLY